MRSEAGPAASQSSTSTCPNRSPAAAIRGEQVGGPAEQAGQVHPAQVGEGLAVPRQEPLELGPGGVGGRGGRRFGRAVLQHEERVGDLGHERLAAQQVAQRRPRRPVLAGQQAGDGAPLLGAGDQPEGPVVAADHVEGEPGEGGDGQAVEAAGQPG